MRNVLGVMVAVAMLVAVPANAKDPTGWDRLLCQSHHSDEKCEQINKAWEERRAALKAKSPDLFKRLSEKKPHVGTTRVYDIPPEIADQILMESRINELEGRLQ